LVSLPFFNLSSARRPYFLQLNHTFWDSYRKEAGETQNHIRSLQGKHYITDDMANDIIIRYEEVIRGINGYINWVREKKGVKK